MAASASSKPPAAGRDFSAIARQFEEDVLAGRFPAAPIFVAAIERQRREEAEPPEGFAFQPDVGALACRRMERFPFAGDGPKRGESFRLEPWQAWVVWVLFSWVDPVSGFRRWREASIWLPKGNGKSPLAALIALCIIVMGKGGEQVYSAATTQDQARCVFDMARDMLNIDTDSALREGRRSIVEHFGLVVEEHRIKGARDGRIYRPISAEHRSAEGIRPTLVILDEVHVQANRKLYDNLKTACNKVDGSMILGISTAGFDMSPQALGWQLYSRARGVLERKLESPTTFALIVEADRSLNPLDFDTWKQANPNLGVSVSVAGLKSAMQAMATTPSERPSLEVKHLGWWQQTSSAFLDIAQWNALGDPLLTLDDIDPDEWEIFVGVDLARTQDLSAAPVVAARTREDGKREYRIITRWIYLPEESDTLKLIPELKGWSKDGWIALLPGNTMTFRALSGDVGGLLERYPNVTACVDDWMAGEVEGDMAEAGVTVVSVRQGAKTQSEPMKELESAILDKRIQHDGSPVAAVCLENLMAKSDRNGNLAPTRQDRYHKIDVAVGIINALVLARNTDGGTHQGDVLLA